MAINFLLVISSLLIEARKAKLQIKRHRRRLPRVLSDDIAPICEAAKVPQKNHPRSDGSRRRPLARGRSNKEKEASWCSNSDYAHYTRDRPTIGPTTPTRAASTTHTDRTPHLRTSGNAFWAHWRSEARGRHDQGKIRVVSQAGGARG